MKKKTKKTTYKSKRSSHSSWYDLYCEQRQLFYQNNPRIQVLLGMLIVSFAIAIGFLYYDKTIVYIGLSLDQEGIHYPYVDPPELLK